ncbi:hypothetical protein PAXINDRAFT_15102 [Paxillus involutus ATCC 200175]|uniref:Uncharacterized protein n=1 Tax=Paxillus involutus ATCC 200175 TaxID=664439 RepID=A0A0C9STG6_PAXIN|nr:hypothetical protein PAXINDRAFT_15102 [Paxillus involutus ATCC 200175]
MDPTNMNVDGPLQEDDLYVDDDRDARMDVDLQADDQEFPSNLDDGDMHATGPCISQSFNSPPKLPNKLLSPAATPPHPTDILAPTMGPA